VQYYEKHCIEIKTLDVIELHKKHTGFNLNEENILKKFAIFYQCMISYNKIAISR